MLLLPYGTLVVVLLQVVKESSAATHKYYSRVRHFGRVLVYRREVASAVSVLHEHVVGDAACVSAW